MTIGFLRYDITGLYIPDALHLSPHALSCAGYGESG